MPSSVRNVPCAGNALAALVVGVLCPHDPAIFRDELTHDVPFAHVDARPAGIVEKQFVEFHPLDLVGVGTSNERLGYDVAEVDADYVSSRAPTPYTTEFWREARLRKIIANPENFADPEGIRQSRFSNLISWKFFLLEQKNSVAALCDQCSDR
jgi:hypothetical protein